MTGSQRNPCHSERGGCQQSPSHRFDLLGDYTHVGVAAGREKEGPLFVIEYAAEAQE